eukprot:GEMP01105146.1.p1 GENE.GEMP01105146.1~~GEMP01105146.1.p1  ORF type:complete len:181 (-),score=51.92 GEMP01105146.1:136-678(-)
MWDTADVGDWVTLTGRYGKPFGKFRKVTAVYVTNVDRTAGPAMATIILPMHLALMSNDNMAKKYVETQVPLRNTKLYFEDMRFIQQKLLDVLKKDLPVMALEESAVRQRVKVENGREMEAEPPQKRMKLAEIAEAKEEQKLRDSMKRLLHMEKNTPPRQKTESHKSEKMPHKMPGKMESA